jgi:hypothetical protein
MSNVIELLERIGQDASLRNGGSQAIASFLNATSLSAPERTAVGSGDRAKIEAAVHAKGNVCCILAPVEDGECDEKEPARKVS